MALRFDAWPNPADVPTSDPRIDSRQSGTFQADWTSRTPTLGWGMYGTGVDAQAAADQANLWASSRGIDGWTFLCILPPEIYGATVDADPVRQDFSIPFQRYLASPYKSRVKFMLLLQAISMRYPYPGFPSTPANSTDGGSYLAQWGAYVANLLADPQYLRVDGKPVIGLYTASQMPTAMWNTFKAAVGLPFTLVDWNHSTGDAARLGATVLAAYPPNPGLPVGNGQHAYSEQVTVDKSLSAPVGYNYASIVTGVLDQRPLSHSGLDAVVPWVDQPTQPEFYAHVYEMIRRVSSGIRPYFTTLHSWNEHAEDGPGLEPTLAEGTRYIDAVSWARWPDARPTSYTYSLSTECAAFVKTGAGWAMARLLGTACFGNREMTSSTAGDAITLTHVAWKGATIYGSTGPGLGSVEIRLDGALLATVSTAAGATTRHVALWNGSFAVGTHVLSVTAVGNGQVRLDAAGIVCDPSLF